MYRIEEVESIHLITLESILLEGSGKDDACLFGQAMRQFHPVDVGHLDVKEQQVRLERFDGVDSLDRVSKRSQQFQFRRFLYVRLQEPNGQRLVIDDDTGEKHIVFRVMVYRILYIPTGRDQSVWRVMLTW